MENFTLQIGPYSFLILRTSPWESSICLSPLLSLILAPLLFSSLAACPYLHSLSVHLAFDLFFLLHWFGRPQHQAAGARAAAPPTRALGRRAAGSARASAGRSHGAGRARLSAGASGPTRAQAHRQADAWACARSSGAALRKLARCEARSRQGGRCSAGSLGGRSRRRGSARGAAERTGGSARCRR
jgi:hypothetical protein